MKCPMVIKEASLKEIGEAFKKDIKDPRLGTNLKNLLRGRKIPWINTTYGGSNYSFQNTKAVQAIMKRKDLGNNGKMKLLLQKKLMKKI